MEKLSVPFDVSPVEADERPPAGVPPEHVPLLLSQKKASLCADEKTSGVVVAADTVAVYDGQLLGKPDGPSAARDRLQQLRGASHEVITGVTVREVSASNEASMSCVTEVILRSYDDDEIETYIETGKPMDRAGGYGIQDRDFRPVESVQGCSANVMGLPICMIPELFQEVGVQDHSPKHTGCEPSGSGGCRLDIHE